MNLVQFFFDVVFSSKLKLVTNSTPKTNTAPQLVAWRDFFLDTIQRVSNKSNNKERAPAKMQIDFVFVTLIIFKRVTCSFSALCYSCLFQCFFCLFNIQHTNKRTHTPAFVIIKHKNIPQFSLPTSTTSTALFSCKFTNIHTRTFSLSQYASLTNRLTQLSKM